jgi:hypothetical protein
MNLQELEALNLKIFEVIAGSHAYGTSTPQSDTDTRGLFIQPLASRLSLLERVDEVSDDTQDTKFYELRKFVELALKCNPNIIELFWTPEDCIKYVHPVMQLLLNNRKLFVSQAAFPAFSGYAYAQIKKAKGQNKWVNNPQPEKQPTKEDFCWFIPKEGLDPEDYPKATAHYEGELWVMPYRPQPMSKFDPNLLKHCFTAALEHTSNVYRLYDYGVYAESKGGVFRGDDTLVCESIPVKDELTKFIGLLLYNKGEFDRALKDWHSYWDWRNNRNEARWVDQEGGKVDFDQKNMQHCIRLLMSGENILRYGEPLVRFEGADLQYLRDIRANKFSYEEIMADVERRMVVFKEVKDGVHIIPKKPDAKRVNELYLQMLDMWEEFLKQNQ